MNRSDVRKAFKNIGYAVTFKRNPFNDNLCNIGFKDENMLKPIIVSSANCYSAETFEKHRQAFDLANSLKGVELEDTEQKIV